MVDGGVDGKYQRIQCAAALAADLSSMQKQSKCSRNVTEAKSVKLHRCSHLISCELRTMFGMLMDGCDLCVAFGWFG